jgi:hypothetical protein
MKKTTVIPVSSCVIAGLIDADSFVASIPRLEEVIHTHHDTMVQGQEIRAVCVCVSYAS